MSAEQQAIESFAKMPLSRLRKYQTINEIQTRLAYRDKKDFALERLQKMAQILTEAVLIKTSN